MGIKTSKNNLGENRRRTFVTLITRRCRSWCCNPVGCLPLLWISRSFCCAFGAS